MIRGGGLSPPPPTRTNSTFALEDIYLSRTFLNGFAAFASAYSCSLLSSDIYAFYTSSSDFLLFLIAELARGHLPEHAAEIAACKLVRLSFHLSWNRFLGSQNVTNPGSDYVSNTWIKQYNTPLGC
jgi:hypothetical protein